MGNVGSGGWYVLLHCRFCRRIVSSVGVYSQCARTGMFALPTSHKQVSCIRLESTKILVSSSICFRSFLCKMFTHSIRRRLPKTGLSTQSNFIDYHKVSWFIFSISFVVSCRFRSLLTAGLHYHDIALAKVDGRITMYKYEGSDMHTVHTLNQPISETRTFKAARLKSIMRELG